MLQGEISPSFFIQRKEFIFAISIIAAISAMLIWDEWIAPKMSKT